jgi:hypothetical protein
MAGARAVVLSVSCLSLAVLAGTAHAQCGVATSTLRASDFRQYSYFGKAADMGLINGSVSAVIGVGAHDLGTTADAGKVYFFTRNGQGQWNETGSVVSSVTQSAEQFGSAVSLSDPYLAVGASGTQGSRGSISIFERTNGSWMRSYPV